LNVLECAAKLRPHSNCDFIPVMQWTPLQVKLKFSQGDAADQRKKDVD
jgi:hypothetical protein